MYIIEIYRDWQDENQSLSTVKVLNDFMQPIFTSIGLERGWKNNKNNISCIPKGAYKVVLEYSNRFNKDLWEIKDVPNRSECKFHSANYWHELNGCISLGRKPKYLDADKYLDITNSKNTMIDFNKALKGQKEALLIIKTRPSLN